MKNLFFAGALSLAIIVSVGGKVSAAETPNSSKVKGTAVVTDYEKMKYVTNPFHEGEKPIKTVKDKDTGVVVDYYKIPAIEPFTAGSWDKIGDEPWIIENGPYLTQTDGIHASKGGDYMIRIPTHAYETDYPLDRQLYVEVWEADAYPNPDDPVFSDHIYDPNQGYDLVLRSIDNFLDGSENEAEFYTTHWADYNLANGSTTISVSYWD